MTRKATKQDIEYLTGLALRLWPGHTENEMKADLSGLLSRKDAAFFLAFDGEILVGYSHVLSLFTYHIYRKRFHAVTGL